ncbi:hypothetical protein D3C81_1665650 [compost metagenome]
MQHVLNSIILIVVGLDRSATVVRFDQVFAQRHNIVAFDVRYCKQFRVDLEAVLLLRQELDQLKQKTAVHALMRAVVQPLDAVPASALDPWVVLCVVYLEAEALGDLHLHVDLTAAHLHPGRVEFADVDVRIIHLSRSHLHASVDD